MSLQVLVNWRSKTQMSTMLDYNRRTWAAGCGPHAVQLRGLFIKAQVLTRSSSNQDARAQNKKGLRATPKQPGRNQGRHQLPAGLRVF
jgi:hypothetical protein